MNQRLFVVRNLKRWTLVRCVLVCLFLVLGGLAYQFFWNFKNSFLKFHNASQYKPVMAEHTGFYGRANDILMRALKDRYDVAYDLGNLAGLYKRLEFYYPPKQDDYLASPEDIRLIGFKPNREERGFYFNSYLSTLINLQRSDLTNRYFNIEFDSLRREIKRITVDSTLYNLSLQNNNWKGTITFPDPFEQVAPDSRYLIFEHRFLPLFKSNFDTTLFYNSEPKNWQEITASVPVKFELSDYERFFNDLNQVDQALSKPYLLRYNSSEPFSESSIRLLNTGKQLLIQTRATDITILGGNRKIVANRDTTLPLPSEPGLIKLILRTRDRKKEYTAYVVKSSPFSKGSTPQNDGNTNQRLHLDTASLDLFAAQALHQLEIGVTEKDPVNTVALSNNVLLSKYLENKIKQKVELLRRDRAIIAGDDDEFEMSMCLLDIATGEVVAAPFYGSTFPKNNVDEFTNRRNFNFVRHNIGSTFKPLLSLAAVLKYPSLANFILLPTETKWLSPVKCQVLGYPTMPYGIDRQTHLPRNIFWPVAPVDRTQFLYASHDNYPVALTMLALTERSDKKAFSALTKAGGHNAEFNNLYRLNGCTSSSRLVLPSFYSGTMLKDVASSSFVNLVSNLYDIASNIKDSTFRTITYDSGVLRNLATHRNSFFQLYPDLSNLGTAYFGNASSDTTDFRKLELFVLGEQNNVWSNVKLAEAYSRALSKHKVEASLLQNSMQKPAYLFAAPGALFHGKDGDHYSFPVTTDDMESAWAAFMSDWRKAVVSTGNGQPLLKPAYDNFCAGVPGHEQYYFYCKTGTPEAFNDLINDKIYKKGKKRIWCNEGLFAFGITNHDQKYPKGLVGVVYIKHLSLNESRAVNSGTARDFLTPEIYQKIVFFNQNRIPKP
jgi:hypothetical protein